jgi:shikimate dehydrogenase
MDKYGLIGKNIGFSFSKTFFTAKFLQEKRSDTYVNFDINTIDKLRAIVKENSNLRGLNITIPFKESVIPLLDRIDKEAKKIGAVNTVKINRNGKLVGYNTDHYGFAKSLADFLPMREKTALILGTGGAAKAIAYVLDTMDFDYRYVSRTKHKTNLTYTELNNTIISRYFLIVNCTPLGTFPKTEEFPDIPYEFLTHDHVLFDLIYNPRETEFLKMGQAKGARVTNGLKMLAYQAKKAWHIWKS